MEQPSSLPAQPREFLLTALEAGYTDAVACAAAGIDFPSYERWLERGSSEELGEYYEFSEDVEVAKNRALMHVETVLLRRIAGGDWRAAVWYLERRYPEEWGPGATPDLDFTSDRELGQPPISRDRSTIDSRVRRPALEERPQLPAGGTTSERPGTSAATESTIMWDLEAALLFATAIGRTYAEIKSRQLLLERGEHDAETGEPTDQAQLTAAIHRSCQRIFDLARAVAGTYQSVGSGTEGTTSKTAGPDQSDATEY